jgi:hypothetical protein
MLIGNARYGVDNPSMIISPTCTSATELLPRFKEQGYVVVSAETVSECAQVPLHELLALNVNWQDLPPDLYLKDGGSYRQRRHSSLILNETETTLVPQRAHWQPLTYNALHGGMLRWYEPSNLSYLPDSPCVKILQWLRSVAQAATEYSSTQQATWFFETHQFRIDTAQGIGRPTPEGAHRDGVDFVAVFLIDRVSVRGGETRVFNVHDEHARRFTLTQPWSLLLMDDARVIHETTPIQPQEWAGWRDTWVVTLRGGGFLEEG